MNTNKNMTACQTIPLFSVYVIWCRCTNKFYVGVTRREVERRIREHRHSKRQFLDKEIQCLGWEGNFDWWVVESHILVNLISEREKYWVEYFGCVHPEGYNRTCGGIRYFKFSDETRKKIGKANRGKPSAKKGVPHTAEEKANLSAKMKGKNNPMYGKHHTTEAKEKNRQSHLGKRHTAETIARISASVKGENHPMYGKDHKPEAKAKIGKASQGRSSPMKGKHHTEKTKAILREKALARAAAKRAAKEAAEKAAAENAAKDSK